MNNSLTKDKQAEYRSSLYKLLAMVFLQEPTYEMISLLGSSGIINKQAVLGKLFREGIQSRYSKEFVERLVLEYNRLFYGPGKHCAPYESVYREGEGSLWGKTTVKVKKYVESLGLDYHSDWHGLPDHIGIELELMQRLTSKEKEGWEKGDETAAYSCLQYEYEFINDHLIQWVPVFCEMVLQEASVPFYREIARVTKEFIESEHKEVQIILSKIKRKDGLMKKKETVKNVV